MAGYESGRDAHRDAAQLFDGQRLALQRHLAGLHKQGLGDMVGKSSTVIAEYESDRTRPGAEAVSRLCAALGVSPELLQAGRPLVTPGPVGPHFRGLRTTTTALRQQAVAFAQVAVGVARGLERHVPLPEVTLDREPGADGDAAAEAARAVRSRLGVPSGPLPHLARLVESHGVLVIFSPGQLREVGPYPFHNATRPAVVLSPGHSDYYRQRWDLAHELGHLVMHGGTEPGPRVLEEQADQFAAELLLPRADLSGLLPDRADWPALHRLKAEWGTNLQALLARAAGLGVLSTARYRSAHRSGLERGWWKSEPGPHPEVEQPRLLADARERLGSMGVDAARLAAQEQLPERLVGFVTAGDMVSRALRQAERHQSAPASGRPASLLMDWAD